MGPLKQNALLVLWGIGGALLSLWPFLASSFLVSPESKNVKQLRIDRSSPIEPGSLAPNLVLDFVLDFHAIIGIKTRSKGVKIPSSGIRARF